MRVHSSQTQRAEVVGKGFQAAVEPALPLNGERDRPGRPAARPAQQLPSAMVRALAHLISNAPISTLVSHSSGELLRAHGSRGGCCPASLEASDASCSIPMEFR